MGKSINQSIKPGLHPFNDSKIFERWSGKYISIIALPHYSHHTFTGLVQGNLFNFIVKSINQSPAYSIQQQTNFDDDMENKLGLMALPIYIYTVKPAHVVTSV
jgi:hypothetical protein